ncbi:MAG TPA: NADH-quinone oxidoreductase subunit L [Bacteroidales bacterium]|nr:NADH-quinone oxidoreductase subunit L [Bacteroidales bacterium]
MLHLLWLIPALPLAGFLILSLLGARMNKKLIAYIGAGSIGISALFVILISIRFLVLLPEEAGFNQLLWSWINIPGLKINAALHLDALSLVFIFVITFVGFLIHLYSTAFMKEEEGYARFFAYMNLFIGSMLTLVLADNLLLLYLGWEGVGLCSYLLIGFWYKDAGNGYAARKAFIVTRIGDTAMFIGLLLLFTSFNTLNIQEIMNKAPDMFTSGSPVIIAATLLLLGGAVGKSAQLPLQTWLPDAMAGPSPVSALIHAATMVTAGVYLIARTHVLFALAPGVQLLVAIIGAATLLLAGFSALTQTDIKRVLAYSTISQIGYMFLALGVGAWSAAVFHFMIHAFFKALLFLAAGVIILNLHHEHNMFKMGGLRKSMPLTFWTFLIGAGSLAALPLVTAGFYSKDFILWQAWSTSQGSVWLWAAGLVGAFITAIYTFRMVFITFFGESNNTPEGKYSLAMAIPLVTLAVLSVMGGFVEIPDTLGNWPAFSNLLHSMLPAPVNTAGGTGTEAILQAIAALIALAGVWIAYHFYIRKPELANSLKTSWNGLHRYWYSGWGFDTLYQTLFIRPAVYLANIDKKDFIDQIYNGIAAFSKFLNRMLSITQTGRLRWYLAGIVAGAIISFTLMLLT